MPSQKKSVNLLKAPRVYIYIYIYIYIYRERERERERLKKLSPTIIAHNFLNAVIQRDIL